MNYFNNVLQWIKRQAKQKSTATGASLFILALVWPTVSPIISNYLVNIEDAHPVTVMICRGVSYAIGLLCIVYNEESESNS